MNENWLRLVPVADFPEMKRHWSRDWKLAQRKAAALSLGGNFRSDTLFVACFTWVGEGFGNVPLNNVCVVKLQPFEPFRNPPECGQIHIPPYKCMENAPRQRQAGSGVDFG